MAAPLLTDGGSQRMGDGSGDRLGFSWWVRVPTELRWCLAAAGAVLAALVVSYGELTADWFADEAWRANFVRSPDWWDLYTSWDTPTPPGFILLFRGIGTVLPTGPLALRIGTLVTLVVTLLVMLRLMLNIVDRRPVDWPSRIVGSSAARESADQRRSMQVAAVASCLVVPLVSAFGVHRTFVPYFLETAFSAALLLGCERLDRHRAAWPALLIVVGATPAFTIAPLFLLPATAVYVTLWSWRQPDRRSRLVWTTAVFAVTAMEAMAVYWFAYRPVAKDTISTYWSGSSLKEHPGRVGGLFGDSLRLLRDGVLSWAHPSASDHFGPVVWLLFAACLAVGLVSIGRRWPAWIGFLVSGWICIALASLVTGWPMTPERVNLPVFLMVYVALLYGGVRLASLLARELVPLTGAAALVLVALLWPTDKTELFGDAFLRGLTPDLAVVADSPAQHNVVLTYHFATRWYAEDALVTRSPGGRDYVVVPETYTDLSVYDPPAVAATVAAMPAGSGIWCVIAFDVGPDNAERACQVPPGLRLIVEQRGERSLIRGYLKD